MAARLIALALFLSASGTFGAQDCRVMDPELQGAYAGPCVNGLAEGYGYASGTAEYQGEFKAGMKHGKGVKRWPNGDRYEGDWVEDRREGVGKYLWGRGRWAGESYEGAYRNDRRHGFGRYRWPSGDAYAGPWEEDRITGPATPMMIARAKFEEEAKRAVGKEGQKVCRAMLIGLVYEEWIRGVVVAVGGEKIAVRLDEPGRQAHVIAGVEVRKGDVIWDDPQAWTPCY